jgi:carnitine O-acetyltransferase
VDRHLLALNKVAQGVTPRSPPLSFGDASCSPAMFTDPAFGAASTWVMSTSNVTTPWNVIFNFGPVCDDGYGLGYLVHEDELIVNVTSWHSSKYADSGAMAEAIREASRILRDTVERGVAREGEKQ